MKKNIGFLVLVTLAFAWMPGCHDAGDSVANASRADQEKAFKGDPSRIPDNVKQMMAHPPGGGPPPGAVPPGATKK